MFLHLLPDAASLSSNAQAAAIERIPMETDTTLLIITFLFIVLDVVSGFIQAIKNKNLSSGKMRDGIFHKMSFLFCIALAALGEFAILNIDELDFDAPLVLGICIYIITTEIVSIIENIGKMNDDILTSKLLSLFKVKEEFLPKTKIK